MAGSKYLLIISRDPFESNDIGHAYDLAKGLKDGGGAVRHYRNAIRLDPKAFRPYMALSQYYSATGRQSSPLIMRCTLPLSYP